VKIFGKMLQKRDALRESGDSGFTLIELLVVILIIGILSAVVVISLGGTSKDATAKACAQDAATVLSALDNFEVASTGGNGSFPDASGTAVGSSTTSTMTGGVNISNGAGNNGTFYTYKPYVLADLTTALKVNTVVGSSMVPTYLSKIPDMTNEITIYLINGSGTAAGTGTGLTQNIIAVGPSAAWITKYPGAVCTVAGI